MPKESPIYVLVSRIPLNPVEGQKVTEHCYHAHGYWTDKTKAEAAAKRHSLFASELKEGE